MTKIKKVEVVPLDINYGKIINSFNTQDDKTQNAPSINIVETALNTKANSNNVYTKIESDDKYFVKDNLAVIGVASTTIEAETSTGQANMRFNYPEGFTKENIINVSTKVDFENFGSYTIYPQPLDSGLEYQIFLNNNDIMMHFDNSYIGSSVTFQIFLMK